MSIKEQSKLILNAHAHPRYGFVVVVVVVVVVVRTTRMYAVKGGRRVTLLMYYRPHSSILPCPLIVSGSVLYVYLCFLVLSRPRPKGFISSLASYANCNTAVLNP